MISCKKCSQKESIVKSGFLRGKQRYYCKDCELYFTIEMGDKVKNNKTHQVTIIDIAKSLGVAPSTVSRALNNKTEININTRNEILRVANELDYKPNLLAQSLHRGHTHTLGVVIPNIERPFFAGVLAGIQEVASNTGYRVMICQSNESHQTEIQNIQALITSRVDGLLLSHSKETNTYDHIRSYVEKRMPIVHFDRVCNELNTSKVILEDFKGSFDLVEHLILEGCKRIAIVIGPQQLLICKTRLEGYKSALQKNGLEIDETLIFQGSFKRDDSIRAFEYFMSLPNPPDGVFAMFYQNAIEMMVQAKKRGIKIPEELAFVGFGNELIAELFEPSLTVFQQFPFLIGETAARIILQNIAAKEQFVPYTQTVKGELIIRDSSLKSNH